MRLLPPKNAPSPAYSIARQLTSLQHERREAGASALAQLPPEDSVRILSEAIEKAYRRAYRRETWAICAGIIVGIGTIGQFFAAPDSRWIFKTILAVGNIWFFAIFLIGFRRLTPPELEMIRRLIEQAERATLPSAAGAILDVLKWPLKYPADRDALLKQLARLLALADDDTARSLTEAQLKTLAELIYPLDAPELALAGLLTLASARYVDGALLTQSASLANEETPVGMAAREYRRMARGVVG